MSRLLLNPGLGQATARACWRPGISIREPKQLQGFALRSDKSDANRLGLGVRMGSA
jgi:hypothetical protein